MPKTKNVEPPKEKDEEELKISPMGGIVAPARVDSLQSGHQLNEEIEDGVSSSSSIEELLASDEEEGIIEDAGEPINIS